MWFVGESLDRNYIVCFKRLSVYELNPELRNNRNTWLIERAALFHNRCQLQLLKFWLFVAIYTYSIDTLYVNSCDFVVPRVFFISSVPEFPWYCQQLTLECVSWVGINTNILMAKALPGTQMNVTSEHLRCTKLPSVSNNANSLCILSLNYKVIEATWPLTSGTDVDKVVEHTSPIRLGQATS